MMTYDEIEKASHEILANLSEEELNRVVDTVIAHYREYGFPYFELDEDRIKKEVNIVIKTDVNKIEMPDNTLQQSMWGLYTCNVFHPELYSTKCNNQNSPMDNFMDDNLFRRILIKRIKHNDRNLNHSCVRRSLTAFGGQAASNFRPTIAKWVYEKFSPAGSSVLDPCMGYGGRLMGAFCSHVGKYEAVDPNTVTVEGNKSLYSYLKKAVPERKNPEVIFNNMAFEDYETSKTFDLIFTSPPYFNVEKYSYDENQSWIRYKEYNSWVDGFLKTLILKSYEYLTPGGYFVLNVGNPIIEDTLRLGNYFFGSHPAVYNMRLSKILGSGKKKEQSHKTEPIFIWKK